MEMVQKDVHTRVAERQMAFAGKAERDPVVESLVQSERREVVKEEFFRESPESYTTTRYLNIKVTMSCRPSF